MFQLHSRGALCELLLADDLQGVRDIHAAQQLPLPARWLSNPSRGLCKRSGCY
jgi:hypothetical protein